MSLFFSIWRIGTAGASIFLLVLLFLLVAVYAPGDILARYAAALCLVLHPVLR